MSTTGLETIDSSLQRTHIWLDEIIAELGPDRRFAWHVLGAVLHAIRDRLPIEVNAHFAAQFPLVVRGLHYAQWSPGSETRPPRSYEAFMQQIADATASARPVGPQDAAGSVFRVLARHLSAGEIAKVQGALPEHIREAWIAATEANAAA